MKFRLLHFFQMIKNKFKFNLKELSSSTNIEKLENKNKINENIYLQQFEKYFFITRVGTIYLYKYQVLIYLRLCTSPEYMYHVMLNNFVLNDLYFYIGGLIMKHYADVIIL